MLLLLLVRNRKDHREYGTTRSVERGRYPTTLRFHNLSADRQTKPHACFLGGQKWLKEPLGYFWGQAWAGVSDANLYFFSALTQ
jgi:hypothetical protein